MEKLNNTRIWFNGHTRKYVKGCPFLIRLRVVGGSIQDGYRTADNQLFQVMECILHNHDKDGNLLPASIVQPVNQEERREDEEDLQITQN